MTNTVAEQSKNNQAPLKRGWFITLEGGEGTGKSTQAKMLAESLADGGMDIVQTREPGGSPQAEEIRRVLLSGSAEFLGPHMEAILFAAARSDHVEKVIRPALGSGKTVICDRFFDSTRVYQGSAGVGGLMLSRLEKIACEGCWPDITIILDLDPEIGTARATAGEEPDRFERESLEKHQAWRDAYLQIAASEPERCLVIDATGEQQAIHNRIVEAVRNRMEKLSPGWHDSERADVDA